MGQALFVLVVVIGLTVTVFVTTRVWVATAMTAVFGAAMGVVVVARQSSKRGDMLF